ncbi:MAG: ATP-binding cassette domain-containing protein [Saprospiraceae bacterium]|nr:ATP-binding cassette domain-containing protein [Saprospiraceae bacterium]MCB9319188.1 ATP-binding cassette domain-containing protein [Lewinellaceae bacterium]
MQNTEAVGELNFRTLFRHLLKFRAGVLYAILLYVIWTATELSIPFLTRLLVDEGIFFSDKSFIIYIIAAIIIFNIGGMLADFSKTWILRNIGVRINIVIVEHYYSKLLKNNYLGFKNINEGQVIQNVNDNVRIEMFLTDGIITLINSIFSLGLFSMVLFFFNSTIAVVFIVSICILVGWEILFLGVSAKIDHERYNMNSRIQSEVIQAVKGVFDIKMNKLESRHLKLWHELHQYTSNIRLSILRLVQLYKGGNLISSEIRDGIIFAIACFSIINGHMTLGALLAIQYILGRTRQPMHDTLQFLQDREYAKLSLKRLQDFYETVSDDTWTRRSEERIDADILLENVTYFYPTTNHGVANVNLTLKHGHKLAFIGESGNGKSTLLNIMNGLITPEKGKVIFRHRTNDYHPSECCIGAVSQDGHIFDESILYNITLSEDAEYPRARLEDLLRISCLTEVVNDLPDKLHTKLGKNGVTLSKGQFQRILIARALYKDCGILIFDEPTSALDIKTSNEIIDNILTAYPNKTIIVATHKLFVANKMDYVVLLKKGQIIKEFDLTDGAENKGVTINDLM